MRRVSLAVALSVAILVLGGCLQAEPRVGVYADVDKPVVLSSQGERVVVKVGLKGLTVPVMPGRIPLNVAIVLDKSGSMGSDYKMENARQGAIEVIERLDRDDIVSVIVYDNYPRVVIPAQKIRDKDALIETISCVYAGGSTALYGGVTLGAEQVRRHMSRKYINRIILLSDGLANVGPQSTGELARLGCDLSEEGITVTTIGVGLDYNEDLMTALASRSGGNAYFASAGHELPRIFTEEIGEAMSVLARDVRIRVWCPDEVKPIGILGREGELEDQTMSVTVGELYGKSDKFALFEVEVPENEAGKELTIARISVEYEDPHSNKIVEDERTVMVTYDESEEVVEERQNTGIVKDAALNRTSEVKREAVRLADQGQFEAAANLIKENAVELENLAEKCDNDGELLEEASVCDEIVVGITANRGLTSYARKSVVNQAYTRSIQQSFVSQEDEQKKDEDAGKDQD
jgi:Ca-activated chloride channel family protein